MSRYSDIRRGAQLAEAQQQYIQHISTPRDPNIGSRGPRPPQKPVYVVPYTFDLGAVDEVLQVNNSVTGYAALAANINGVATAEVTDALGAKNVAPMNGFRPARIVWVSAANKTLVAKRSEITNQLYGSYANTTRHSCAFGSTADADDMHDAFAAIKVAILAANAGLEINRVSLTRENLSYR